MNLKILIMCQQTYWFNLCPTQVFVSDLQSSESFQVRVPEGLEARPLKPQPASQEKIREIVLPKMNSISL